MRVLSEEAYLLLIVVEYHKILCFGDIGKLQKHVQYCNIISYSSEGQSQF